jgi:hypothetical protein
MPFNDPNWSRKEVELIPQTVLEMSQKRKVQTCLTARSEDDERGRTHTDLRDVLDVQARATKCFGGRDTCALAHFTFKEIVQA